MIVYHGSTMIVREPDIEHSFRPLDFGKGFYVTSNREQAEKWARRKAQYVEGGKPYVNCYRLSDDTADLRIKNTHESAKEILLDKLINRIVQKGEKVIVWSIFTGNIDYFCKKYKLLKSVKITGKMSVDERNRSGTILPGTTGRENNLLPCSKSRAVVRGCHGCLLQEQAFPGYLLWKRRSAVSGL